MTRLNDYLRAERPDLTEPASFYVPGARDWASAKKGRPDLPKGGANEETVSGDAPLDTNDEPEIVNEVAAAQTAAAIEQLQDT